MTWTPLLIAAALAGFGSGAGPGDTVKPRQLTSSEISLAFRGHLVAYSPPHFFDAGIHEEFHEGGRWAGTRYSRGPVPFAGRWKVEKNELCVRSESGLSGKTWERRWVCRKVSKDTSGKLFMPHLTLGLALKLEPMELSVRQLPQ
jgi:hypothetical protein